MRGRRGLVLLLAGFLHELLFLLLGKVAGDDLKLRSRFECVNHLVGRYLAHEEKERRRSFLHLAAHLFDEILANSIVGEVRAKGPDGKTKTLEIPYAGDSGILLRGQDKDQVNITCNTIGSGELYGFRVDKSMPPETRSGSIPKVKADAPLGRWNRFVITMKKDRVTVVLNGKTVIDDTPTPGLPARGPIGLQHHGDPVQFANLFIKEL